MSAAETHRPAARESTGRLASLVAAGILLSRLVGLVRQRVFAHYFGLSDAADAFSAAFRIPNFLQNMFGEGVLSASFIPVYARLLAEGEEEESGRVAGAVFAILAVTVSVLVLIGVLATPWLIDAIAPGFVGSKRALTVSLVRILFPGAGLLVFSAWCLGILNSHRRLFLSYAAPVVWNVAMIATLLLFGPRHNGLDALAVALAWGSVVGSALQFAVQLPSVLRLARTLRIRFDTHSSQVREILRNFVPVFISRGVYQISAYIDALLASLLGRGAVAGFTTAQTIYILPVSLFGMSVSAAELPVMSSALGSAEQISSALRTRLDSGLRHIAFFVVPSAVAFLAFGDLIAGGLFQTGRFRHADSMYVWAILAGSAVGLLASTMGRLYSSAYYALRDTRTPLRFAIVRVVLTTVLGYTCAIPVPHWLGIDPRWGAAGLTASAGVAGWVEFALLRRGLNARIGTTGLPFAFVGRLWSAALAGAAVGTLLRFVPYVHHVILRAGIVLAPFGVVYFAFAAAFGIEEGRRLLRRVLRARR